MKHPYLSKRYWNTILPPLSKTNEMSGRYSDVINLSVGDPDYPVDPVILQGMYEEALQGHTKYTAFMGDEDLREAICNWYQEDYACHYTPDNIMITSGGTHAMYLLMESLLDEGDEVLLIAPYYTYYEPQIHLPRGKVVLYNTNAQDDFEIHLPSLRRHITPRTKVVIVNSPNNPTGRVYQEETMKGLLGLAEEFDFLVVADDIYGAYNYTHRQSTLCALSPNHPRLITVYSFSKDFAMTGFRLGFVIAEKSIAECLRNVNEAVNFTINAMAQRSGLYAIRHRRRIQEAIRSEYKKRAFYAYERIQKLKNITCKPPEGTFYLFADIRQTGLSSEEIWEKILDEAHVLILPGTGFGEAGAGFIRIACTCNVQTLAIAFDRMAQMKLFRI